MTTMPISATAWTSRPMEAGARGAGVLVVVLVVVARGRQAPRGPRRCRGDEDDITAVSEKIRAGPRVVP